MDPTGEDVRASLKATLEMKGVLTQLRAQLREEVSKAIVSNANDSNTSKPVLSNENLLINELIREYLKFNNYNVTLSALLSESGQPRAPLDRAFLANELNLRETASSTARAPATAAATSAPGSSASSSDQSMVPLLYSLLHQSVSKSNLPSVLR